MRADTIDIQATFEAVFKSRPTLVSVAPGRVTVIGEHTDYNQGFVLPVAIDRKVRVAAAPRQDRKVRVYSAQYEARDEWRVDSPRRTGRTEWRDYVRGVGWALVDGRYEIGGADLAIAGDVPQGAGLSSSAALEVAVAGALCAVSGIEVDRRDLALLCQKAENQFVGVQCGIMDQFAAALGEAGHAVLIDCQSLEVERVPMRLEDEGVALVIVDSKAPRRLSETAYNERREECAEAARMLGLESLRDADELSVEALPEPLLRRARHVVRENERVLGTVEALKGSNLERAGGLMYESHESLRRDFQVSCVELDRLVGLARGVSGTLGARLTGAGFGGCTVNLVRTAAIDDFRARVVDSYASETGLAAEMLVCRPSDGLEVIRV
jgi:galactokinase